MLLSFCKKIGGRIAAATGDPVRSSEFLFQRLIAMQRAFLARVLAAAVMISLLFNYSTIVGYALRLSHIYNTIIYTVSQN